MIIAVITRGQQVKPQSSSALQQQFNQLLYQNNLQQQHQQQQLLLQQQQQQKPQAQAQVQQPQQPDPQFIPITFQYSNENQISQLSAAEPYQQSPTNTLHSGPVRLQPAQSIAKYTSNDLEFIREFAWNLFQVRNGIFWK